MLCFASVCADCLNLALKRVGQNKQDGVSSPSWEIGSCLMPEQAAYGY